MRLSTMLRAMLVGSALILAPSAAYAIPDVIALPDPIEGGNSLTYGTQGTATTYDDFHVYSMPYLNFLLTGDASNNFGIDSSPGLIKDYVVILSGPAAARDNSDTLGAGGGDDAYEAVSGNGPDRERFGTSGTEGGAPNAANLADPGGAGQFSGDQDGWWDVRLDALRDYLQDDTGNKLDPVFMYNMNEQGTGLEQDELVWGEIRLHDDSGLLPDLSFIFDGTTIIAAFMPSVNGGDYDFDDLTGTGSTDGPGNLLSADGVADAGIAGVVHGVICVGHDLANTPASRTLIALGSCPAAPAGMVYELIDQNLGAETAVFAVINDALSDAVWNLGYDVMHVDFRNGRIDNGYEQLFIGGQLRTETEVPEPAALLLLGSGLAGLGLMRRRRN